ncbi:MAG: CDP-alcohol phosphatidyltransferase family protein [Thermodesulfobacteriota bacterium]
MPSPPGKDRFDQARLINIANGLTAMRVLLVPLFVYFMLAGKGRIALGIFALCGLTDGLDGILARRLRQRTLVGAYLDPIADKLLMATAFIVLAYVEAVPLWLTILVISRDLFIVVGSSLYLLLIDASDIRPTGISKLNTAVQILTVVYFLAYTAFPEVRRFLPAGDESAIRPVVIGLCALTTAVSGAQYLYMGIQTLSDG